MYQYNSNLFEVAKKHKEFFAHEGVVCEKKENFPLNTLKEKAKSLYKYLLSGEARENFIKLEPVSNTDVQIFHSEPPGYIAINKDVLAVCDQHFKSLPGISWHDAIEEKQNINNQLLNLHGIQQVRQIHIGRDMTWKST